MEYTKDMVLPHTTQCEPIAVQVEAGRSYSWCTCGLSEKQPLCDSAHRQTWYVENGEEIKPWKSMKFTAEKDEEVWLCVCKHTSTPPFCDNTHLKVAAKKEQ